jgi:hypothetical protein
VNIDLLTLLYGQFERGVYEAMKAGPRRSDGSPVAGR